MPPAKPRPPYQTLAAPIRHEIDPIKGSRFITDARAVQTEDEAERAIAAVREEFPDARHHCYAYVLRDPAIERSSDDGEPGGSAGRPILAQLTGRELFDLCVVVVRYFGGVKLGVGGLVRAYGGAAAKTLDRAELLTVTPTRMLALEHDYSDTAAIQATLGSLGLAPAASDHAATVTLHVRVPDADWDAVCESLMNATSGRVRLRDC